MIVVFNQQDLQDAQLNKDLFNDGPDSPIVIGEDSDDDEVRLESVLAAWCPMLIVI